MQQGPEAFPFHAMGIHSFLGAVVAQWIRPQTLNREVPSSNLLAATVVPIGKSSLPSPSERTYSYWSPGCLFIGSLLS